MLQHEYFKCDMCGLCCQKVGTSSIYAHLDRGDGVCKYYEDVTHKCSIYAGRPVICNVDAFYRMYLTKEITKEDYYLRNYVVCKKLKKDFREKEKGKCFV